MTKQKGLALALALVLFLGLMGGVVSARNNSPAAPAVANELLREAGHPGGGADHAPRGPGDATRGGISCIQS